MGISTHTFRALLKEHRHKPLKGKGLLIGRQSILFSREQMVSVAEQEGVPLRKVDMTKDERTRAGGELLDTELFRGFCDLEIQALDVTDYEQAEVVHDMNQPLPEALAGKYDFVFNGSCMDNLFNPATFVVNVSKLLRPGGRVLHVEHASPWPSAYLSYSPDWFLDYYAANNFEDCLVLLNEFDGYKSPHHMQSVWRSFRWNPLLCGNIREHSMLLNQSHRVILCLAEKGAASTEDKYPLQGQYRAPDPEIDVQLEFVYRRFVSSARPAFYRNCPAAAWNLSPAVSNLEFLGFL